MCHEVVYDGKKANCITNETGILTVSSEIACQSKCRQPRQSAITDLNFNYQEAIDETLEKFDEHLNAYSASEVESRVKYKIRKEKNNCQQCLKVFHENEMISDSLITRKMLTNGKDVQSQPCKSTVDIIKAINKIHELLPHNGYDVKLIIMTVLQNLDYERIFNGTEFDGHIDPEKEETHNWPISHKENFIRNIVECYVNMKAHNFYGKKSDEERGAYIRHDNKKQTHFAGQ